MTKTSRIEFLSQVSAFAGVSTEGLSSLHDICSVVEKKEGDVIIKEGEQGDCVYLIEEGQVEISMSITMASGESKNQPVEKVLVRLGPGAMFGEMAFIFDHDIRSATIVATTDGRLLSISSSDFRDFAKHNIEDAFIIISNIARIIAKRLRKTNEDVKKLTTVLSVALRRPRKVF